MALHPNSNNTRINLPSEVTLQQLLTPTLSYIIKCNLQASSAPEFFETLSHYSLEDLGFDKQLFQTLLQSVKKPKTDLTRKTSAAVTSSEKTAISKKISQEKSHPPKSYAETRFTSVQQLPTLQTPNTLKPALKAHSLTRAEGKLMGATLEDSGSSLRKFRVKMAETDEKKNFRELMEEAHRKEEGQKIHLPKFEWAGNDNLGLAGGSVIEDTPMFREKLKTLETNIGVFQTNLKKFSKTARQMVEEGHKTKSSSLRVADELLQFRTGYGNDSNDQALQDSYLRFSTLLKNIEGFRENFLLEVENSVVRPLEKMEPLQEVSDLAKKLEKATQVFQQLDAKKSGLKKGSQNSSSQKFQTDVTQARKMMKELCYSLAFKLNDAENSRKYEFLKIMSQYLFYAYTFFEKGFKFFQEFDPYLNQIFQALTEKKNLSDSATQDPRRFTTEVTVSNPQERSSLQKQGYLFMKTPKGWKKRFFVLNAGILLEKKENVVKNYHTLLTCTVKPKLDTDRLHCFELIGPTFSVVLQADNENHRNEWCTILGNNILQELGSQSISNTAKTQTTSNLNEIQSVPENKVCCDCSAPDPEWICLPSGSIVCIECSGQHRNNISKVRSLTLDRFDPQQLKTFNNKEVNKKYEARLSQLNVTKPSPTTKREDKFTYIYEKYILKKFYQH